MNKKGSGFTLLELVIVIIVISILATLGLTQYTKMIEKGRGTEARVVLGYIRTAQEIYRLENNSYTGTINQLVVSVPTTCQPTHYFSYDTALNGVGFTATATRCTSGGKNPQGQAGWSLVLSVANFTAEPAWISTPAGQY